MPDYTDLIKREKDPNKKAEYERLKAEKVADMVSKNIDYTKAQDVKKYNTMPVEKPQVQAQMQSQPKTQIYNDVENIYNDVKSGKLSTDKYALELGNIWRGDNTGISNADLNANTKSRQEQYLKENPAYANTPEGLINAGLSNGTIIVNAQGQYINSNGQPIGQVVNGVLTNGQGQTIGNSTAPLQPNFYEMYNKIYGQQIAQKNAAVNTSANSQLDIINQNLAKAMSALESERSTVKPGYEKAMTDVSNRQFSTGETQKELMNMAGWDPKSSGLAVGEMGKIAVGADASRSAINADLVQAMADIQKRSTEASDITTQSKANIERQRAEGLASAATDASIYADQTAYNRMQELANTQYNQGRDTLADTRYTEQQKLAEQDRAAQQFASTIDYNKDLTQQLADMEKQGIPKTDYRYVETQKARLDKLNQIQIANKQAQKELLNAQNEKIKFDYEKDQDKIQNDQWLKQFNEGTRKSLVQEAISRGQLSVSQGQLALSKSKEAFDRTQVGKTSAKDLAKAELTATVDSALKAMMGSGDPTGWLQEKMSNGSLKSDEAAELIKLYNSFMNKNAQSGTQYTP